MLAEVGDKRCAYVHYKNEYFRFQYFNKDEPKRVPEQEGEKKYEFGPSDWKSYDDDNSEMCLEDEQLEGKSCCLRRKNWTVGVIVVGVLFVCRILIGAVHKSSRQ